MYYRVILLSNQEVRLFKITREGWVSENPSSHQMQREHPLLNSVTVLPLPVWPDTWVLEWNLRSHGLSVSPSLWFPGSVTLNSTLRLCTLSYKMRNSHKVFWKPWYDTNVRYHYYFGWSKAISFSFLVLRPCILRRPMSYRTRISQGPGQREHKIT